MKNIEVGDFLCCRFGLVKGPVKPGKPQESRLECYIGNREKGKLFLVDRHMSAIPEKHVEVGVFYYCGVNGEIGRMGDRRIMTVTVIEKIDFRAGAFYDYDTPRHGTQWQCRREGSNADFTFIVDEECKKKVQKVGEIWTFQCKKVVSVLDGLVMMSVELDRSFNSERQMARYLREKDEAMHTKKDSPSTENVAKATAGKPKDESIAA